MCVRNTGRAREWTQIEIERKMLREIDRQRRELKNEHKYKGNVERDRQTELKNEHKYKENGERDRQTELRNGQKEREC